MNITEYRALKAEQEAKGTVADAQTTTPNPESESKVEAQTAEVTPTQPNAGTEESAPVTSSEPKTVTIEGLGEVDLEELKNGYLRQTDYVKQAQELADQQRQLEKVATLYDAVQSNPERAQQLAQEFNVPHLDPQVDYVSELQTKYHDLLLEKEIGEMVQKYPDFNPQEVLPIALEKKLDNLEDAYLLHKSRNPVAPVTQAPVDVESIKEQIRQELLKELELERNTTSLITSGGGTNQVSDNQPTLSSAELRVAQMMRMSPSDYATWRDKK